MSAGRSRAISEDLRKALLKLTPTERLEFLEMLWDSLAGEEESEAFELTAAQREDLDQRIRDLARIRTDRVPGKRFGSASQRGGGKRVIADSSPGLVRAT